jgi:hypothetical protein
VKRHANLLPAHRPFYTEDHGGCHPSFSIIMPVADCLRAVVGSSNNHPRASIVRAHVAILPPGGRKPLTRRPVLHHTSLSTCPVQRPTIDRMLESIGKCWPSRGTSSDGKYVVSFTSTARMTRETGACAITSPCLVRWLRATATASSPGPREGKQDVASPPFCLSRSTSTPHATTPALVFSRLIIGSTEA